MPSDLAHLSTATSVTVSATTTIANNTAVATLQCAP